MRRKQNTIKRLIAIGLVTAAFNATAVAHNGATGIVKKRMNAMSAIGKAVKSIATMVKGDTGYDRAALKAAASTIRGHSGDNLTRLFPAGSGGGKSEARPDIWQNWEQFEMLADELNRQAVHLASLEARPSPMEFGKLAATCKGCHEKFRLKKN